MNPQSIPHMTIVVGATVAAILGYFAFSVYVLAWTHDAALHGDILGTWKSFAVLAFGFWLGSSSGGKMRETKPSQVEVTNEEPIPVTETKS